MNMQTIFDAGTRDELLRRVDTIQAGSPRQWGKMSAAQMLEHTARALEMATGRKASKQALPGKLLAWMFRKSFVGEKPFGKNAPTDPSFIVRDDPALEPAREKVKELIRELHTAGEHGCDGRVHSFFGTLTGAEWGVTQFKHVDHHLRQFGA
jgi:hypothetical protein